MTRWDTHFQTLSRSQPASFGADSIDDVIGDDVIGAPGVVVTTSPTPSQPWDFSRVPMPLIWALGLFGGAAVLSGTYHLGEVLGNTRQKHRVVRVSHVRRKLGARHTKETALREALARMPDGWNADDVTKVGA